MTLLHAIRTTITWTNADRGRWVADDDGAFAGTIDQHGDHFFVRNGFAEYVGDYRTLAQAKTALTEHLGRGRYGLAC
jgi:hypothetical protein